MSVAPLPRTTQSAHDHLGGHARRPARATVPLPPGEMTLQPRAHLALRPRPAGPAARVLRALRPGLHAAGSSTTTPSSCSGRRRTTTCWSRTPSNFLWRDGPPARPDPAAGRRAADDRRRLPPHAPQADAAGVPPRADRGRHRGDARRRSTARSTSCAPGEVVDLYDWTRARRAARRDAGAVRDRPRHRARRRA